MPVLRYENGIPLLGRRVPVMRRKLVAPRTVRPESAAGFTKQRIRYEGEGDEGRDHDPHKGADRALGLQIKHCLDTNYPGHLWWVQVQHKTRVALIKIPLLHEWPYVIHLKTLASDPGMKSVIRAGGQMLERHRIPRSGFSFANLLDATKRYGNPVFTRQEAPPE